MQPNVRLSVTESEENLVVLRQNKVQNESATWRSVELTLVPSVLTTDGAILLATGF